MEKRMSNRYSCICALPLAWSVSSAFAQTSDSGFYLGLGGGQSSYSIDLSRQINAAYAGNMAYLVNRAQVTDDSDGAYKIFAGYRFSPWFSLEAAVTDSGRAAAFYQLENIQPGTFTGQVDVQSEYRLRGLDVLAIAEYPLGESFGVSLRAGLVASRLSYREHGTFSTGDHPSYDFSAHAENQVKPLAGLGLAWHLRPQWDLRFDWDRSFDQGKEFGLTNNQNGRLDHVDQYCLDVIYRLGR
jgi:OOP family OmpA-OmpF porin